VKKQIAESRLWQRSLLVFAAFRPFLGDSRLAVSGYINSLPLAAGGRCKTIHPRPVFN
jgi:hypothetical protein